MDDIMADATLYILELTGLPIGWDANLLFSTLRSLIHVWAVDATTGVVALASLREAASLVVAKPEKKDDDDDHDDGAESSSGAAAKMTTAVQNVLFRARWYRPKPSPTMPRT